MAHSSQVPYHFVEAPITKSFLRIPTDAHFVPKCGNLFEEFGSFEEIREALSPASACQLVAREAP